ncbi:MULTISPECIES: crotonase/enoyl-CoA hydratase family protein [Alcaligenes]|jgi:enoyl-CoA hydratase|uniref:Enoyl-CoA hydratase n=2 Tax=Alcaligenes TaxID=507 RepID=A0A3G2HS21_9BURK|nr:MULTISPECIES: crotonase/enoyl-CoA hydratase family protein [Alcaligenes]ASR88664.1 enoyl-CoA hydratase [Alcaligenes faecalis]AWG35599.1 enoyl-CoA hydratase [Alcaligenes aquatilis]AYN19933.1 enoyl-CoA hydratase [Alcaligenes aquatilis]MCC9163862.1 crotonase/enoyl-CoA hydratase family protein [Alcaligenes sp. MMA]MCH4225367.1 crotonase/enoyl-CoA hydratase family protein [Alcaligenes faecalis]
MSELVTLERIGKVLLITLNRPEARNAINLETAQALAQALDEFDADPSIAVGVLTGANNTFCAGMDLKAFAKTGQRPYVGDRGFAGICERPPAKPLIAAVEGYCLAGGFEIALSCDLIVAADSANFGLPEVKRGIVPGSGGMVRLPSRVPYHMAMEMVLTGGMYPAARMAELGLVSRLAEPGKATEQALALAEQIAANGPLAVQTAKSIISQSRDWRQSDLFDLQRPRIAAIFTSADAKEGATAFAEKREPVWQGK